MTDRAQVKVLPPFIPMVALVLGWAVHFVYPTELATPYLVVPFGILFVALSIGIIVATIFEISKAKTAFDVRKSTTRLVTTGIFRMSRNPTYLSMMFVCFGIALLANSLPMFLTSILVGSALCVLWSYATKKHI